jgi:hypothetical protein
MTRRAAALLLLFAAMLADCSALDPFPTTPRAAQPGTPAAQRVAICYNRLTTSLAEVQAQAQQECSADTVAAPVDTDWYLQNCPLLLPGHATFVCTTKK